MRAAAVFAIFIAAILLIIGFGSIRDAESSTLGTLIIIVAFAIAGVAALLGVQGGREAQEAAEQRRHDEMMDEIRRQK